MALTKPIAAKKSGFRYWAVRLPDEMITRLKELAGSETDRSGYPVTVTSLVRKFIINGMVGMTKQEKVSK